MADITKWTTGEILSVARKLYKLSLAEWGVVALLADNWNHNKQAAWPKVGTLAKEVGCSPDTVRRAIRSLASRRMDGLPDKGKDKDFDKENKDNLEAAVFLARKQPSPHAPNDYTFPWLRSEKAQSLLNNRRTPKADRLTAPRPKPKRFQYTPRSAANLKAIAKSCETKHGGKMTVSASDKAHMERFLQQGKRAGLSPGTLALMGTGMQECTPGYADMPTQSGMQICLPLSENHPPHTQSDPFPSQDKKRVRPVGKRQVVSGRA